MVMFRESLMERTRRLLRTCGKSMPNVHADLRAQGSQIGYFWLRKFASGDVKDPSVNRVEELYRYLTGMPVVPDVDEGLAVARRFESSFTPVPGGVQPPWMKTKQSA